MKNSPNTPTNNDFLPFLPPPENDSIKYFKQVIPVTSHHFYITDELAEVEPYIELINVLKTAEQHDTVFIYLNTPGGSLYTAVQIISAMNQSRATVVTCLEGEVCSAGTLIFLSGTKHIVNRHCSFMIHNYSHWLGGKGNEVSVRVKHTESYFRKMAQTVYKNFLTEEEIEEVLEGKDIWMDSEEVLTRLGIDINTLDEDQEEIPVEERKVTKKPAKKPAKKKTSRRT